MAVKKALLDRNGALKYHYGIGKPNSIFFLFLTTWGNPCFLNRVLQQFGLCLFHNYFRHWLNGFDIRRLEAISKTFIKTMSKESIKNTSQEIWYVYHTSIFMLLSTSSKIKNETANFCRCTKVSTTNQCIFVKI